MVAQVPHVALQSLSKTKKRKFWHNVALRLILLRTPDLSVVAYISVEISLGSCWCGDILRVKGQGFIINCNFL